MRFVAALLSFLASALAVPSLAQDIPSRVGRVAYIEGSAAVYMDPEEGWEKAFANSPLTSENSIWTDPGSRAEVRVGGTALRLDEATQLDVARLDEEGLEAFVPRGTVAVRVRHYERGRDLVFDTPHARFSLRADGRYRVDVDPDLEESRITVFSGDARVGSDSGPVRARAGETVRVFGGDNASYVVERAYSVAFDNWARQRDSRWVETRSVRYVSPDMTGYEDLDSYGSWSEEPEYGALWYPTRVASDWAPYRYGRWDYVRPWGWTWVDDSPWGYAPFHYGRWVYVRNRWAWHPGKREARPVWAPALVAWIGGSNLSVGISSGPSVGWYPLSPWDRYQPWYKASPTYINRVNTVVINTAPRRDQVQWRDYTRNRGATVVSREAVVDRRPVQQARVNVKPEVIAAAAATTVAVASVLPPRAEVVQRRVAQRSREVGKQPAGPAPRPGQATVAGPNNNPAARPEFKPRTAAVNSTPRRAEAAPAPARPVTKPSASATARQERAAQPREAQERTPSPASPVTRETRETQRTAPPASPVTRETQRTPSTLPATTRESQQQAREAQQREREAQQAQQRQQQQQAREAQEREAQQKQQAREAQTNSQQRQQQQREAQQRDAQQRDAQQREAQQNQQRQQQQQQQQAREAQQREAQQKQQQAREAQQAQQRQQQQQQQQAREAQQREAQQREGQQKQQQAREAQQAQQAQQRQQQQQQQQAREAQQREAQQRQQQAREAQQAQQRQQQQQAREAQPQAQPQQRPRPQREEKEKDKDDDDKKGRGR
jgi:hypothetical protein